MTDRKSRLRRLGSQFLRASVCVPGIVIVSAALDMAISQSLPTTLVTNPASGPLVTTQASTPFSSWFTGGAPGALNAAVSPADSLNFSNNTANQNTDFYRWSYRMFLWLTSPTPSTYGGTGLVMSSPEFYNVTQNAAGDFVMKANPTNPFIHLGPIRALEMARAHPPAPLHLGVRMANLGPHDLPLVHDAEGDFFEVLPAKLSKAGKPLVLNAEGREIELARVVAGAQGRPRFLDTAGRTISAPKLQTRPRALKSVGLDALRLRQSAKPQFVFRIDPSVIARNSIFHGPIFIFPSGAVINGVIGDSEGNVQVTQNGSVIYYGIAVNDVYAYFVSQINPLHNTLFTSSSTNPDSLPQFPTTASSLAAIQTFATSKSHTLLDPNSLAMEIKTSWVDASTLSSASNYITMKAVVPTFDKTNPAQWKENGTKTITVALIGMHVVGSTAGHPEMVWSTFEHFGNAPNVAYAFTNPSGTQVTQPADPATSSPQWLFTAPGSSQPSPASSGLFAANAQATFTSAGVANGIKAVNSTTSVKGTSIARLAPWGAPSDQSPNPLISSIAASNTQVISLNNDIHSQMNASDVRNNYFFMGATWTEGGSPPAGAFPGGINVGTSSLANSTLETFSQRAKFNAGNGCLSCHTSTSSHISTVTVSHLFSDMVALF